MKVKWNLADVIPVGEALIDALRPSSEQIEFAGSIRRQKHQIGDIEILCRPKKAKLLINSQMSLFEEPGYTEINDPGLMRVIKEYKIIRGDLDGKDAKQVSFMLPEGIQVDLFTANIANYGYIKILRTGSHEYNTRYFMPKLKRAGYVLDDGYLWHKGKMVHVPEEIDVYRLMGASEIDPPELRGEIGERAKEIRISRYTASYSFKNRITEERSRIIKPASVETNYLQLNLKHRV